MAHARRPLTHDENRHKVCVVCFQKGGYPITPIVLQRIQRNFIEDFDLNEECCPAAICGKCRSDLQDIDCGKKDLSVLPEVFDFAKVLPEYVRSTRAVPNPTCNCEICNVARVSLSFTMRKKGRPGKTAPPFPTTDRCIVKICTACKTPVGRGKSHKCNVSTLRKNLISVCEDVDDRTKDILASKIITDKCEEQNTKHIKLQTRGPNDLPIGVHEEKVNSTRFTSQQMSSLQVVMGASNKQMKCEIIPFIRSVMGRSSVERKTETFLQNRDKHLEDFFKHTTIDFDDGLKPVVYCNNVPALVEHVCNVRDLDYGSRDLNIKLGIDSGGCFMKFCLSIFSSSDSSTSSTERKTYLDSSVKKIIIIAIIPDLKETHGNVQKVMDLLQFTNIDFEYTYAMDFKLANIVAGLQSHGCTYPCLYCECPKSEFSTSKARQYPLRTIGEVSKHAAAFRSIRNAEAKNFKSCVNQPLIRAADNDIFIRHIPPPELHMLLRITNKLFKEMEKSDIGKLVAHRWIQELGITRPQFHSNEFTGNMCKKLLTHLDVLHRLVMEKNAPELIPFISALSTFNDVRLACFGMELSEDFEERISNFKDKYLALDITVTPSVHVLLCHVFQFCRFQKASLGKFSEQASESVHRDFKELWQSTGKVDFHNKNYEANLYKTVLRYNGRHV